MAGDWIKWMKGLTRRREVAAVARSLDIDRRIVACACMEFWEWADDNTTTGYIDDLTTDDIDSLIGITGFASALRTVGWLEIRNGGIQLPRWDRHNAQSAKARALNGRSQSRHRSANGAVVSRSDRDKSVTREEKRRDKEEKTAARPAVGRGFGGDQKNGHSAGDPWEFEIDILTTVLPEHISSESALCSIHRRISRDFPEAVPPGESGLRRIFMAAAKSIRVGKSNPLTLFRWLVCNPGRAKFDGRDGNLGAFRLKLHRKAIAENPSAFKAEAIPLPDEAKS